MSEESDQNLVIKDIDLPLYKFGIVYRHDIDNFFQNQNKVRIQKFKSYVLNFWLFINIIRFIWYIIICKNGKIPIYYFDLVQYVGGIPEFYYAMSILPLMLSMFIIYLFNHKNQKYLNWFHIIRAINGIKTWNQIGISDQIEIKNYVNKLKNLKCIIEVIT